MTQAKLNKIPERRQISNFDGAIDGNILTAVIDKLAPFTDVDAVTTVGD